MSIKLLFFAQCADWVRRRELELPWSGPATVAELIDRHEILSALKQRRDVLKVAVNEELSGFDKEIQDGDECAFLPPVSGG